MKRYVFASLVSLITVPTMADNWIKFTSQAVEDTINTIVAQECRQAAADEYQKQMDQTTGKISVIGIYKVCSVACKDIRSNKGYSDCRYFINQLAEKSGFGTKSATQANCANTFNGIWSLTHDGKEYQCVGKDGFKLVYQKSCDKAGGDCIKDFASLKTQGPVGREFIAEYAKKKNLNLTCKVGFETRRKVSSPLGQDYIMCSAGGKSYEFEFDSLNQDVGKTSIESENKALCEFFGGKIVKHPDSSVEKDWQSCDIARNKCEGALHDLALRIGHTNMYQGYCRLSREAKSTNEVFLNHIDGVDNYVFYKGGAQMRADMAKVQAEEYLRNTFPKEGYIHCGTEVKKLEKPEVDPDFVMTCTVGSKQVDFVFADLTEGGKKRANTGVDAMQCIISGGTFNGESCRGPTKDECTKLDVALRAKGSTEGTYWDDGVRACILGNAMKTYKADVATNYIVGAVVIVGSALLVIGTDGLATPVVVENLALLAGDAGINYAIDWNHRRLSKAAANRFGDFIDDADKCTDEQCVLNVLKKHYATLSDVMNDLNKDDQATVDAVMDRLIGLIQTEFVACGKNDSGQTIYASPADCAMQTSTLRAIDYIDKASEPVLIIGSIIYNPGWVTSRFIKVKKVSKVAKDLNVTYKDAKQLIKAGDVVQDASGIAMRADDAARAAAYEEKLADAYKKYAPKNQSFDDFKKMFANEDEFDKQIEAWSSFEPGMVDVPITPRFTEEKYVPSPYSTYDPELAKQLKAIDSEYADDIAKLDAERDDLMHQKLEYEMERKRPFLEEDFKIREQAKEKLGHLPFGDDWDKPELQDLKLQMDDLKARMASAPVSPEEQAITLKREELQNLKEGYETARDYEKGKIIKATIPDDVADAVAETRRQELIDIIAEDDELFAQAENFSDLSDSEKQAFLQKIHSRLDEVTHVKGDRVTTFKDPKSSIVASAARQYNLTPLGTNLNLDEILETIVHEQSHLMDRDAQDLGMLGAQIAKEKYNVPISVFETQWEPHWDWSTMTPVEERYIPIEAKEIYKTSPTEVSSYKVGSYGEHHMMQQIIEKRASKK